MKTKHLLLVFVMLMLTALTAIAQNAVDDYRQQLKNQSNTQALYMQGKNAGAHLTESKTIKLVKQ